MTSQKEEQKGGAAPPAEVGTPVVLCPKCGGENRLAAGERFLVCAFCSSTLFVDRTGVVGHFQLPRLLDRAGATSALKRWMAGNDTVKDLDRKSKITDLTAMRFPMWLFRIRERNREVVVVEPAAPTPVPSLADLEVPAGKLEPYAEPEAGAASLPVSIPLETARGWLEQRSAGAVEEISLVEVPLWRAGYAYEGSEFQALIDGSTGRVLASVYPEKAESPYILVAILGLVLFGLEGLVIQSPLAKLVAYAITAVPLILLAYFVTRKV